MIKQWIIDASPLIILGKADLLSIISPLAEKWFIPHTVIAEVSQKSDIKTMLKDLSNS
jgi:hypothetical protein